MNLQKMIIVVSFIFIVIFTSLFVAIKMDLKEQYNTTQKELTGIKKISNINLLDTQIKSLRGMSQLNKIDADRMRKSLLLSENKTLLEVQNLKNKRIERNYLDCISSSNISKKVLFNNFTQTLDLLHDLRFDITDESMLLFEADRDLYFLMTIGILKMPFMLENIAKIRGIGSSILSQDKPISEDDKFELRNNTILFLDTTKEIKFILSKVALNNTNKLDVFIDSILNDFHIIQSYVQDIENNNATLNSKDYFLQTTKVINDINTLLLFINESLTSSLTQRSENLRDEIIVIHIIYILLLLASLILAYISYLKNNAYEKLRKKKKLEITFRNLMINEYSKNLSLIDLCEISLTIIINNFKALNGSLYLYNKDNQKLYLATSYGIKAGDIPQTIDLHENTISENILEKKIKTIDIEQDISLGNVKIKSAKLITIPILEFNDSIGTFQLLFDSRFENVDTDFLQEVVSLTGSYIFKAHKDSESNRYLKLIDKNVLISKADLHGNILEVSEELCKLSQYTKEELIGQNHRILKHSDMPSELYLDIWETIVNGNTWYGEIKNRKKDGSHYWVDSVIAPDFDMNGNQIGYTALRTDITDKKIIEVISITDGLTSLHNRRHFDNIFIQQVEINKRAKDAFLVFVLMDIDHFKQYNDTYGHQEGDTTLKLVADALKDTLRRPDDYTFRLGGEEFGLLYHTKNRDDALEIANQARINIENIKIDHSGNSASKYVTISSGLYIIEADDKTTCEEIYKKADEALYIAKESGRNQVCLSNKR